MTAIVHMVHAPFRWEDPTPAPDGTPWGFTLPIEQVLVVLRDSGGPVLALDARRSAAKLGILGIHREVAADSRRHRAHPLDVAEVHAVELPPQRGLGEPEDTHSRAHDPSRSGEQ